MNRNLKKTIGIAVMLMMSFFFEASVLAEGLTYQWYKNGKAILGATEASYSVNSVTESDYAEYTVVVSNENGETTSYPVYLTRDTESDVPATPQPLAYQWYKDGKAISGATSANYMVKDITEADFGKYSVVVSNENGETTSYPAYLTKDDREGGLPLYYQWYKDGKAIPGAAATSYTIDSVTSADAGSYHAVVSNDFGSVTSDDAVLTVESSGPVNPTISFEVEGDGTSLVLDFVGTLYESDDAVNWRVVEGAKSPFTVDITKSKKFYYCVQ